MIQNHCYVYCVLPSQSHLCDVTAAFPRTDRVDRDTLMLMSKKGCLDMERSIVITWKYTIFHLKREMHIRLLIANIPGREKISSKEDSQDNCLGFLVYKIIRESNWCVLISLQSRISVSVVSNSKAGNVFLIGVKMPVTFLRTLSDALIFVSMQWPI